ncbi:Predicted metalloprotease, contains C-terminal PDZ domain [Parapedobacter luteus]|uniref:Predicted metalloprotease, contains C-terminal PDZ domain n=2 Tax=Parapedobacter luteus TaxID=623280 RepID=A0A1T5CHE1_9SPHI|nr:Predicted metalloprotease, contains C-terminal PDZ domain [Parapedobacter luteus]
MKLHAIAILANFALPNYVTMKQLCTKLCLLMTTVITSTFAAPRIHFEVSFSEPQAHYAEIKMEISDIRKDYVDVKMPVWTPGSYLVREYSKNVESFEACDENGAQLPVTKINKNTWRISSDKRSQVVVNYRVYGFEVSVRTNFIDDAHAFLSPAATFMYVDGMINHPVDVTIIPHPSWSKISTGLEPVSGRPNTYHAADFDILFDSPIEIGNQDVFTFEAAGVLHEIAMVGGGNYDRERLKKDGAKIVEEATRIFGVNPNKRYVFIVHNYQSGGGGLEHLNSTVLGASRNGYQNERSYLSFLGLVAHEYFHLWHVKRLRPIELGPFNYDAENYTTALWIMEGFTAYFDNLLLRRCGFLNESSYLQALANDVNTVENRAGNRLQPVALASFDAWIKYYRPDENSANTSVSYYNKGALLAMMLDLKILAATQGQQRLDDVLKAAYEEFYVKKKRGFEEHEFQALIERVTGVSVDELFHAAHTVEPLDYNHYLNAVGYELVDYNKGRELPELGMTTTASDGRIIVTGVSRGTGAWNGGINVRDELIAINGERLDVNGRELNRVMQTAAIGDTLNIMVARDGKIRELNVVLGRDTKGAFSIVPLQNATPEQARLGKIWLSLE